MNDILIYTTREKEEINKLLSVQENLQATCRKYEDRIIDNQKEIKAGERNIKQLMDQLSELTKWRPIKTAPKNKRILVTHLPSTTVPPVKIAWFSISLYRNREFPWKVAEHKKLDWNPTHWLPLPRP